MKPIDEVKETGQVFLDPSAIVKNAEFVPKEKTLVLNELKPAFGLAESGDDLVVNIGALSYNDVCCCLKKRDGNFDVLVESLLKLVSKKDSSGAAKEFEKHLGEGGKLSSPTAKYNLEIIRLGTLKPAIDADVLFKLSVHYPMTIQKWADEILELTGATPEIKKKSGD